MDKNEFAELIDIVESNKQLMKVFEALDHIGLRNYYIGAGVVAQSVWNNISGYPLDNGISDIDIVYFDDTHMKEQDEKKIKNEIENYLDEFPLWIDLKNQARVHIWYEEKFGYAIKPYTSLEDAINSWPTTATSLGLRRDKNGDWVIYAPFGVKDIFGMRIKANTRQITEEIYMSKVKKWTKKWPKLSFEPWPETIEPIIHNKLVRVKID